RHASAILRGSPGCSRAASLRSLGIQTEERILTKAFSTQAAGLLRAGWVIGKPHRGRRSVRTRGVSRHTVFSTQAQERSARVALAASRIAALARRVRGESRGPRLSLVEGRLGP